MSGEMNEPAFFNKVYDLLVNIGGASDCGAEKSYFIGAHLKKPLCDEYRFQGKLGFGGKYRRKTNTVDCYPEDMTPERTEIILLLNRQLAMLNADLCSKTG